MLNKINGSLGEKAEENETEILFMVSMGKLDTFRDKTGTQLTISISCYPQTALRLCWAYDGVRS